MSMHHKKSKCDIYSLNFCLAVKGDLFKFDTDKLEDVQRTFQPIKCNGQEKKFIYSTHPSLQPQWK